MPSFAKAIQKVIDKVAEIPGVGTSVTVRRVTLGSYNASTGVISETTADTTVKAVLQDINDREVNDLVQAADLKCTVAADALTYTPSTKDRVVIDSKVHQIVRIKTFRSGASVLSYELYLRT
jgi:hypothetical protein|tara:strand:- start:259 stop:624 length:366 start_codon:yes stop_codon:yes gene_type:complete